MPGPELKGSTVAASNFRLGVRFSNLEYPPGEDIVGHYFVYGDRTFERTILAKGVFIPLDITSDEHTLDPSTIAAKTYNTTPAPNTGILANTYAFISSDLLLRDKTYKGAYVRFEKIYRDMNQEADDASITLEASGLYTFDDQNKYIGGLDIATQFRYFSRYDLPAQSNLIHTFRSDIYIPKSYPGAQQGTEVYESLSDVTFFNNSINTNHHIIKLNSGHSDIVAAGGAWRGKMFFGSIKQYRDVFSNLYEIKYKKMSNCISRPGTLSTTFTFYGGDTATERISLLDYNYVQHGIPKSEDPASFEFEADAYYLSFQSQSTYTNYEFRHGSKKDKLKQTYKHSKPDDAPLNTNNMNKLVRRKLYQIQDKAFALYPEEYNYNESFSYLDGFEYKYPIQFNHPYCNVCLEDSPYRIWASEKDNIESLKDYNRIVKINNYTDQIGGSTGEVTDLFINNGKLFATTKQALYHVPTRPQTLQTDTNSVFLGTGEPLSVPPIPLKNSDIAFAGQEKFTSRVVTEYGAVYVDSLTGTPIWLAQNAQDISAKRIKSFWEKNGEFELAKQFKLLTNQEFPYNSHASPIGFGYDSAWDPRLRRVIISKKDYKLLPAWEGSFVYVPSDTDVIGAYTTPNKVWFNGHSFYYNDASSNQSKVEFDNVTFFENKSFTTSLRLDDGTPR